MASTNHDRHFLNTLAVAGLILGACGTLSDRDSGETGLVAQLAEVLGPNRVVEPRLTHGFAYSPCTYDRDVGLLAGSSCSPPPTPQTAAFHALHELAPAIRERLNGRQDADGLHAAGVWHLIWHGASDYAIDRAVQRLEQAQAKASQSPRILSDLSAAYFVRAKKKNAPDDLLRALSRAERALKIDAALPEALFNRALALDHLFLLGEARDAWEAYLRADGASRWAEEARVNLQTLVAAQNSYADRFDGEELLLGTNRATLDRARQFAEESPQSARQFVMERLLSQWAEAVLDARRRESEELLGIARVIGQSLAEAGGDHSVFDFVAAIDQSARSKDTLHRLAQAHLAYALGRAHYNDRVYEDSLPQLEAAEAGFAPFSSPARQWAQFLRAAILLQTGEYFPAAEILNSILASSDPRRHVALAGRVHWTLGVIALRQGRYEAAQVEYENAATEFERAREQKNLGAVQFLLTENLKQLGQNQRASMRLYAGLRALHRFPAAVMFHNLLSEGAKIAVERGLPEAALPLQSEAVRVAQRFGNPAFVAEALLWRSRVLKELGSPERVRLDLEEARLQHAQISGAAMRERIGADLLRAEADTQWEADPQEAVTALEVAISYYEEQGLMLHLPSAYLTRAHAYLSMGLRAEAEADLLVAIRIVEGQHDDFSDLEFRVSLLETAEALFDGMILLQVEQGRPEKALEFSERARSTFHALTSPATAGTGRPPGVTADRFAQAIASLPSSTTLVEFAVVPDRLFVWTIRRDGTEFETQPIDRSQLQALTEGFENALRNGGGGAELSRSSLELYEILIAPIRDRLSQGSELVIVLDKFLHRIPFSALKNPTTKRYLVEDFVLRMVPSAFFYLNAESTRTDFSHNGESALLVSNPRFDPSKFPTLRSLPASTAEVGSIAELYELSTVIGGREATKEALLNRLDDFSVLHYAGHARFDEERPSNSRLILAPSADGKNDGVLNASDIQQLRLERLRLVVLSACSTMTPQSSRTGGLSGLAQSFLVAGVPAVVGSLWDVDDESTRHLMVSFHKYLGSENGDAAAALRRAQLELIHSTNLNFISPASWGSFQYTGGE